jgi:hypothetical protein
MKLTLPTCAALVLLLGGCVVTTTEREGLPNGVTLLDSDQGLCSGTVEIDGHPDVRIDEGEQSVLAVDDDEDIEWQCITDLDSDEGEFECPDGTEYIRVSRDEDDSEFTLECYGV